MARRVACAWSSPTRSPALEQTPGTGVSSSCARLRRDGPAVFRGSLRAEVNVVKAGRRIVHLDASVTDQNGDEVALASGSFAVIPGQSRKGR